MENFHPICLLIFSSLIISWLKMHLNVISLFLFPCSFSYIGTLQNKLPSHWLLSCKSVLETIRFDRRMYLTWPRKQFLHKPWTRFDIISLGYCADVLFPVFQFDTLSWKQGVSCKIPIFTNTCISFEVFAKISQDFLVI